MLELVAAAVVTLSPADNHAVRSPVVPFELQDERATDSSTDGFGSYQQDDAGDHIPARRLATWSSDFDAPEWEVSLAFRGPVVLLGAFGGRHEGMPKLAHVGLVWAM
ncbi:hypothetical protein [Qipengyuania sp.]|uniref:hypothetical protein n=1 Tax=Qipengyuania sp. TaxID=2004515 RepID=UPI0035C7F7B2